MEYMFKGLAHIGIMTEDPRKCADFYIKNLDFKEIQVIPRGTFEIIMVENYGLVLEFVGRPAQNKDGVIAHIAIEVSGIEKTIERLRKNGVEFEGDEAKLMEGFFPFACRNIFFTGPAGERVELVDFSEARK